MIEILSIAQNTATNFNNIVGKSAQEFNNSQEFLNNMIGTLVSPQNIQGINGWLFDVARNQQLEIEADITDHYMEDNSFINDHIVIRPIIIQLSGYIGELVAENPSGTDAVLNFLADRISNIDAFLGDYTSQAAQRMQEAVSQTQTYANTVNQAISKTKDIIKQFDGQTAFETAQGKAYYDLYSFFISNDLLTVRTPWAVLENMKIQKISLVQPEESEDYSDITITLKQMRFTSTKTVDFSGDIVGFNRNEMQSSDTKDSGNIKGDDSSILFDLGNTANWF